MTGINGFLPNSTGVGAKVLSDVAYAASDALQQGAQVGELPPEYYNKVNRQSTVIASMIGQFIVDYANVDANDSQSIATLEANFRAALTAYINSQSSGSTAQSAQAKGNVVFQATGPGTVTLKPKNGNGLVIGGAVVALAAAGISAGVSGVWVNGVAGQALSASTAYYVSIANLSGTPTLRYWTASSYGHMPDTTAGNIGVEVISSGGSPVTTDSLVGMVYLNASTQFQDTDGALYTLSWHNRRRKKSTTTFSANRSTTITSGFAELGSEIRGGFLTWGGEVVETNFRGSNVATSGASCQTAVGIDNTTPIGPAYETNTVNLSAPYGVTGFDLVDLIAGLSEGLHYATGLGQVQPYQSPTGTWYAASTNNVNGPTGGCQLIVAING